MDRLDRMLAVAGPVLRRVDAALEASGAPPGHAVWAQLRRVRLLPGDAVDAVAALREAPLLDAALRLRAEARGYASLAEALPEPGLWTGTAADSYDRTRRRTAEHLSGTPESLDERLAASADLADALAGWMTAAREAVAAALADILTSLEVAHLTGSDPGGEPTGDAGAAADVAAHVLRAVGDAYDGAREVMDETAGLGSALIATR